MTSWPRALQPWSPWPAAYVACGNTFRTKPSAQANQLLQIRSLLIAQQNAQATSAQVRVDRDAQHTAADKRALSSRNSPSADKGW